MKKRILRLGLVALIAMSIPAAALARGPGHGQEVKAEKQHHGQTSGDPKETGKPETTGKPDDKGKPETAGERPHNHGWYVSQAAKNESLVAKNADGVSTHGAAVSDVAQSDQGKP
jgi:hypothetical protein